MPMIPAIPDVGVRTRRRIAWRLLPFVFLLYLVAYLDRANVSFAALKMNLDLGFSDRIYGLGVAMFFLGYVLFEVPGAIIVERWSARKWTARIMISWGLVTILSGLVRSPRQFYADRKSTRLNSSHSQISYAVFCLKKKTLQDARHLDLIP